MTTLSQGTLVPLLAPPKASVPSTESESHNVHDAHLVGNRAYRLRHGCHKLPQLDVLSGRNQELPKTVAELRLQQGPRDHAFVQMR